MNQWWAGLVGPGSESRQRCSPLGQVLPSRCLEATFYGLGLESCIDNFLHHR